MQISKETIGRLYASGRNYANLLVGFAAGVGLLSASQQKGLTDALGEMYNGVSMIVHGATSAWAIIAVVAAPIIGPMLARMASNSAKTVSQANALHAAVVDPNTPIPPETKAVILNTANEVVKQ